MIITIVGRHDNNYTKVCVNNSNTSNNNRLSIIIHNHIIFF